MADAEEWLEDYWEERVLLVANLELSPERFINFMEEVTSSNGSVPAALLSNTWSPFPRKERPAGPHVLDR